VTPIKCFASKCSSAMAGDANDAEVPKISRSITCSREAFWEGMWKKISSPCASIAIKLSTSATIAASKRSSSRSFALYDVAW
jgi:hypothetical protein